MNLVNNNIKATSQVPISAGSGQNVDPWYNERGQAINPAYSFGDGADQIVDVAPAELQSIGPITTLNAVTVSGYGPVIQAGDYTWHSYQVIATSVTVGAQVRIEGSMDNVNWLPITTYTIDSNNNPTGLLYSDQWNFEYARAGLSAVNDGTYTIIEKHKV